MLPSYPPVLIHHLLLQPAHQPLSRGMRARGTARGMLHAGHGTLSSQRSRRDRRGGPHTLLAHRLARASTRLCARRRRRGWRPSGRPTKPLPRRQMRAQSTMPRRGGRRIQGITRRGDSGVKSTGAIPHRRQRPARRRLEPWAQMRRARNGGAALPGWARCLAIDVWHPCSTICCRGGCTSLPTVTMPSPYDLAGDRRLGGSIQFSWEVIVRGRLQYGY